MNTHQGAGAEGKTDSSSIDELRRMRTDVSRLSSNILEHLKSFQREDDSFKTLPVSRNLKDDPKISVGSTCTVLMALLGSDLFRDLPSKRPGRSEGTKVSVPELFERLVKAEWGSSGLRDGNAFSTSIVVRTAGFVVEAGLLTSRKVLQLTHDRHESKDWPVDETIADKTLREIIKNRAGAGDQAFAVSGYPAKATIAYWFMDGALRANISLSRGSWEAIAKWATNEFHRQLIYVSAGNDSLMDPPELAMAACLINRIRRFASGKPELAEISRSLPSTVELTFGIERVLLEQPPSGIWHKYFPLFHFPKGGGAADYCFSFEFLEAVLIEFGTSMLRKDDLLRRFRLSLGWCDRHILHYVSGDGSEYRGWNSGGEVRNLADGMPEAWATASVHMFLTQLNRKIDELLDELILKQRFGIDRNAVERTTKKFDRLIDVGVSLPNEEDTTLLKVLREELIANALDWAANKKPKLEVPRSGLFFGPPGTSKTNLAKSIATYLGWPIVTITPSEFLGKGLEQVHAQVAETFRDLMDLRKVVVLFDEMDALAQTREEDPDGGEGEPLDVTRQLLTTSMLPKLADLWDKQQVVFLMATNHKQQLDPAITRANRFDLLLCVAPPSWLKKRSAVKLREILGVDEAEDVAKELGRLVKRGSKVEQCLDLFTVAELGIFFDHVKRSKAKDSLLPSLRAYKDSQAFSIAVLDWARKGITLREDGAARKEFDRDVQESRRQYFRREVLE